jgi:hypothetical protein
MERLEIDIPETVKEIQFFWELRPPETIAYLHRFSCDPKRMRLTAFSGLA